LVNSVEGNVNRDFWSPICSNHGGGSGPRYLSGWITAFICFSDMGMWMGSRNEIEIRGKTITSEYPIVNTNDVAPGIVSVPVKIDDNGLKEYDTTMFAGSISTNVVDDYTLAPRVDWCIALKK